MKSLLPRGVVVITVVLLLVGEAVLAQNAVQNAVAQQTSGRTQMGVVSKLPEQSLAEGLADFHTAMDNSNLPSEVKSFYDDALGAYNVLAQ